MLATIIRGKAGRVRLPVAQAGADPGAGIGWRDIFKRNEDLLTGVIFGRLQYLSLDGFNRVLGWLIGAENVAGLGDLRSVEFWPSLRGLEGRSRVEPDLVLSFKQGVVMLEVKPPYGGTQSVAQWLNEIGALAAELNEGVRSPVSTLHFVALGRNGGDGSQVEACRRLSVPKRPFELHLHIREWTPLMDETAKWVEECKGTDCAVFEDWISAFELFGLRVARRGLTWSDLCRWARDKCEFDMLRREPPSTRGSWQGLVQFSKDNPIGKGERWAGRKMM